MADIFSRAPLNIEKPITADQVLILWGANDNSSSGTIVTQATNFQMQYQQQVTRRWTLGGGPQANTCVIYPGRPIGTIRIQRLFVDQTEAIFTYPGWDPCGPPASLHIQLGGTSVGGFDPTCNYTGGTYIASGAFATSYGLSAEADGLTIIDDVNIEFMQLSYSSAT